MFNYNLTKSLSLDELIQIAKSCQVPDDISTHFSFDVDHYTRKSLFRNDYLEIILICFSKWQSSTIHDHQGSNCVIRALEGKLLEHTFVQTDELELEEIHYIRKGEISGLDGFQVHQVANVMNETVLLNFYSPPFEV